MLTFDNIPAKLFFKVLKERKFDEVSEAEFTAIYDEFFLQNDNSEAKLYLKTMNQVLFLETKIKICENTFLYLKNPLLSQEQKDEILNELKNSCKVSNEQDLAFLRNDLKIFMMQLDEMKAQPTNEVSFYDSLAQMSQILNRSIDENLTLAMYVANQKLTKKIANKK